MALPPTYNQTLDTMVSTALDTYSTDPINVLTDSGEKFLKAAASQGRVFVVNDAENIRSPLLYDHGEASSLYKPDQLEHLVSSMQTPARSQSNLESVLNLCLDVVSEHAERTWPDAQT